MSDLRKLIKWVLLIQIKLYQIFQVLWAKGKTWEKKLILYFWFNRLWPFNFQFGCRPKSSNHNNLVSAHLVWKLKIVSKISWPRESMVRNPFWDFECFTSGNPCDSSTSPRSNFWPVTPKKFLRHRFSVFHQNLPFSLESWLRWHFGCLM